MSTERWRNGQARILREFIRRGELPPIDVDHAARELVLLAVGPFIDDFMAGRDGDGEEPPPELTERLRVAVHHFVRGRTDYSL